MSTVNLLMCGAASMVCMLYGQYVFAREYPCLIVKMNKSWQKTCAYGLSIPSGILSCLVIGLALYKGVILNKNLV